MSEIQSNQTVRKLTIIDRIGGNVTITYQPKEPLWRCEIAK